MTIPSTQYPGAIDTPAGLLRPLNNWAMALSAPVSIGSTEIAVAPSPLLAALNAAQPTNGALSLGGEVISYSWIDVGANTFMGCSRGQDGTIAGTHGVGTRLELRWIAAHHNILAGALITLQATLGVDPAGPNHTTVAERLMRGLPSLYAFTATTDWSFTHEKHRLVGLQLWREVGVDTYAIFDAPAIQEVDTEGISTVTITLPAVETGYVVAQ